MQYPYMYLVPSLLNIVGVRIETEGYIVLENILLECLFSEYIFSEPNLFGVVFSWKNISLEFTFLECIFSDPCLFEIVFGWFISMY